ncbi:MULTISPECIES: hypothetical protein [Acidocella]|nr:MULTISPECIES: hypothetical protein [Acidocella]WBO58787.1 hypothetical protein GT370_16920 [Acidocella sp. MX-AZ03]
MPRMSRFAAAALLAVSLAPFAAQARPGDIRPSAPRHLVRIAPPPQASQLHGRSAENGRVPVQFGTAPGAVDYANNAGQSDISG